MAVRVFRLMLIGLAGALLASAGVRAQEAGGQSNAYTINGIAVDTVARNTDEARSAAYKIAQRKAWPLLWARLTGTEPASAPHLADGALDAMTAGIEVQGERFSTTRYIATLGVVFDRAHASGYFSSARGALHSEPMLLLPALDDAGVRFVYNGTGSSGAWAAAWLRYRDTVSPIDYVIASGSPGDNILLTGYQTKRGDRSLWRNILSRFKSVDVLIAEARLTHAYPGGPISALFVARHGPDGSELGRFRLRIGSATGLDTLLDAGVRQIDALYVAALQSGQLRSEADLISDLDPIISSAPLFDVPVAGVGAGGLELLVATPDSVSWLATEKALRATPTVFSLTLTSLSLGGSSRVILQHGGTRQMLEYQLGQQGYRLLSVEGGLLLRRRVAGDPVLARPIDPLTVPVIPATGSPTPNKTPPATVKPARKTPVGEPVDLLSGMPR